MFENDNIKYFGEYLRDLRLSLGFSQKDVQAISGVTSDSLRRIEYGEVLPRYDTLLYLSMAYKKDLLEDLKTYSNSISLLDYYYRLDRIIASYDIEALKDLISDFDKYIEKKENDLLVNTRIVGQFRKVLSGISKYNSPNPEKSLEEFIESMQITNPMFNIKNFEGTKYTFFELRILLLIALSLESKKEYVASNSILDFLLKKSNLDKRATTNEKILNIKIYLNLSYNFHKLDLNHQTLEYANAGIDYCNKNHLSYALAHLYYRKGIAEFLIDQPNYLESLEYSISLLRLTNQGELAKIFAKVTLEKYSIEIPNAKKYLVKEDREERR